MVTRIDKAGVISTGSTTERTLEARFADTINIKDFGALGDCVYEYVDDEWVVTSGTDDTAAIQAAIDYAMSSKNLNIYLPAGQYLVTGELIWPYRIGGDDGDDTDNIRPSMFGDGGGGYGNITNYSTSIIHQPTSAINCITDLSGHLHLKDLAIIGNIDADEGTQAGVQIGRGYWGEDTDDPPDGVGNKAGGGADALLMNVHITGCKWGLRTKGNGADRGDVISCSISKNEIGVWLDEKSHNWVFMACSIIGELQADPTTSFCKWGVQVGNKGEHGKPTCRSFIGCNIERSPLGQMWIQEASVLTISGCYFEGGRYGVGTDDGEDEAWYDATEGTGNWQSSRIILLSAENMVDDENTVVISRNIIIQGCYFNGLYKMNGDTDGWHIEYGAADRVKGLTLLNNTYTNSNHGFIKTSESFTSSPNHIIALNNHNPAASSEEAIDFADDTTTDGMFSLRLNDSYEERGECNIGNLTVDEDFTVDGTEISFPNLPEDDPEVAGQLWIEVDTLKVSAG